MAALQMLWPHGANGGTWNDGFHEQTLDGEWTGNRYAFQITNGVLAGQSAFPLGSPLYVVERAVDSTNCDVSCWLNVVVPNMRVCTKAALVLRHSGNDGYVFALHEPTQTLEVYRLSTHEMLLKKDAKLVLRQWYYARAELRGPTMTFYLDGQLIGTVTDTRSPSGSVGLAVQDAEVAWFDEFTVSGPNIVGNIDDISLPTLSPPSKDAHGNIVFRFLASPPYDYFVQASSTPYGYDWQTIQTFRAKIASFEAEVSDPATNGARFYRVQKIHCQCR